MNPIAEAFGALYNFAAVEELGCVQRLASALTKTGLNLKWV